MNSLEVVESERRSPQSGELTAVIIGFGQSGSRFARACSHAHVIVGPIRVVGIADRDPRRIKTISHFNCKTTTDFRSLWAGKPPDLVIVATNDADHFAVLLEISESRLPFRRILCEKPVVTTTEHAVAIRRLFSSKDLSVNFLERFSPAVLQLRDHLQKERLIVRRVDFTWSKYRVKDPRPSSIGVLSEISHALDLSLFLAGIKPHTEFKLVGGYKITSDFTRSSVPAPDELSFSLSFPDGVLISGRSSYVRTRRSRRLEILLSKEGESKIVELAELVLDDPLWDDDQLLIHVVGELGNPQLTSEFLFCSGKTFPVGRRNLEKLCRFVEANAEELHGSSSNVLARLDEALYVQQIIDCAAENVGRIEFSGFERKRSE